MGGLRKGARLLYIYLPKQVLLWQLLSMQELGFVMAPYYGPSNYTMRNSVGYLMRIGINRLLPQLEALFEHEELTFSQWTILVALHDGRISTAGDLAHNICHDAGSLTRLIDQLEKRRLVIRRRSQKDRRVVTLALTAPGRRMVEALAPRVMDFWNRLLSEFTHKEVDTLIALLRRLVAVASGEDDLPRPKGAPLIRAKKRP